MMPLLVEKKQRGSRTRTRTVYEKMHNSELMNEAAVGIQQVLLSKNVSISEAIIVLDLVKHYWMHELIATDIKKDRVLFNIRGE